MGLGLRLGAMFGGVSPPPPTFKIQDSRFKIQDFKIQGSRFKIQDSRFKIQDLSFLSFSFSLNDFELMFDLLLPKQEIINNQDNEG